MPDENKLSRDRWDIRKMNDFVLMENVDNDFPFIF